MRALPLVLLVATGCVTSRVVERYPMPGDAAAVDRAAREAVVKLGWEGEAAASGQFRLTRYPRAERFWRFSERFGLGFTAEAGALKLEGDRLGPDKTELTEAAAILADATRQLLGPQGGPRPMVSPRSAPVTVALDLLLPAGGAVYALAGDPYFDSPPVSWQRGFWAAFAARFIIDACAAAMVWESSVFARDERRYGRPTSLPTMLLVEAAFFVVVNRLAAVVEDLAQLPFRNAYARSGLAPPREPLR
jgi:hypothetical protein